jgi:hypothetical protein
LIPERFSGRTGLGSHRRTRTFLLAFGIACFLFLFPYEGTTHAATHAFFL